VFVHSTNHKGAVAEAKIAAAAVELGVPVLRPQSEHGRYDLVFEIAERFWRVQCKWGAVHPDGGVIRIRVGNCRYTPNGYVRTAYDETEIDLLGIYCGDLDECFLLPVSVISGKRLLHLRTRAPANSQRACITLASDHKFSGAVAQLGERLNGIQEARGSSPLSSTSPADSSQFVGAHEFREHFGYWMEQAAAGVELTVTRHSRPHVRLGPVQLTIPVADPAGSTPAPG
jgi:hypothetical protein